ncbi:MAG: right-handed parallel beta-helix repeat-containing protein [Thermoplasmata archaeon]
MRKKIVMLVVVLLLTSALISGLSYSVVDDDSNKILGGKREHEDSGIYASHAPIRIDDNSELAAEASSGSGTEADPYVIEGYEIDGGGHGYSLYIGNTTDHFIVRDCSLYNASGNSGTYWKNTGLYFYNVINGRSYNNTAYTNTDTGILLNSCSNTDLKIEGCEAYNNDDGIRLKDSSGAWIENCDSHDNAWQGIEIDDHCNNNTVANSTIRHNGHRGIYIDDWDSEDNVLVNNSISVWDETGIHFDGYDAFNNDVRSSNTVNGTSVYLLSYEDNYTLQDKSAVLPSKLEATNYGSIIVYSCENVTVSNCTTANNTNNGIFVGGDNTDLKIEGCEAYNNDDGIRLKDSSGAWIENCDSHDNAWQGSLL